MVLSIQNTAPFIPVYRRLLDEYKDAIITHQLRSGDKIDSINEIMRRHQVSRETAKLVLKLLAKEGFIVQKAGKGSFVANLSPMKKLWGVILPFFSIQYQDLLYHLSHQAWSTGRQLHSFLDHDNWEEEIRLVGQLINERYEAIIILPTLDESRTASFYRSLSSRESHIVLIDHTMAGSAFSYVIGSYDLGVRRGVSYLAEKMPGSNIAFIRNEVTLGRNLVQEMMEETFKDAIAGLSETGLPECKPVIISKVDTVDAVFLGDNHVGGFFCCDDTDAIRVIGRLKGQEKNVGDDYSLVSYGNTELAQYFTPAITSVDPHNPGMAETIAGILKSKIKDENTEFSQYVISPELIIRET